MADKVEVQKTVNMNLNQGDLIEVMIEDFKEELEEKLKKLDKESKDILDQMTKIREQGIAEITKKPDANMVKAMKAFKAVGIETEVTLVVTSHSTVKQFSYDVFYDREKKSPVRDYRQMVQANSFSVAVPSGYYLSLKQKGDTKTDRAFYSFHLNTANTEYKPSASIQKLTEKQLELGERLQTLYNEICKLRIDMHKLENGEKRFKAKFIKASLAKSEEGKSILDMMNSVKGGMKLLS